MTPKPKRSPCLECKDREPGCHGSCERYIEWKKTAEAYGQARRDHHKDSVFGYELAQSNKLEKEKRKKRR